MADPLTPEEREKYMEEYARHLGVEANAFSIAAHLIREHSSYNTALAFCFNLSARIESHSRYIKKAADYFKEYLGDSYKDVDANWLYHAIAGYIQDVDPSYESITTNT